jgi:hypothetical protein
VNGYEFSRRFFGGLANMSAHPESGPRSVADEMLKTAELFYAPLGQDPSSWSESGEFEEVAEALNQGNCPATADREGLTAEFPFGTSDTSLLTIQSTERHPQLGHGLFLKLHLPQAYGRGNAPLTAAMLNTLETRNFTRTHLIGSWCAATMAPGVHVPTFAGFIPNALYRRGLLFNIVLSMGLRSRWAAAETQGESKQAHVGSILLERLQAFFGIRRGS